MPGKDATNLSQFVNQPKATSIKKTYACNLYSLQFDSTDATDAGQLLIFAPHIHT